MKQEKTVGKSMKIICHGDSLTEGSDIEKAYTWTSILEHNLRVPVENHGIGGDTTAGMLSRLPYEVVQQQPAIVIFMGGTNDLWWDLELNLIPAVAFTYRDISLKTLSGVMQKRSFPSKYFFGCHANV